MRCFAGKAREPAVDVAELRGAELSDEKTRADIQKLWVGISALWVLWGLT